MGFDCQAITMIGLRLLEQDLKITICKPFNHCPDKLNNITFLYCPHCGNKNRVGNEMTYQYIEQFSEKELTGPESSDDEFYDQLIGHLIINEHVYLIYKPVEQEEWLYVTLYYGIKHGPRNYKKESIVKVSPDLLTTNSLKEDLTSINLWKEEDYGIYTLIEYSY